MVREMFTTKKRKDKNIVKERKPVASQWELIRWKFLRHKLAVGALIVLLAMYFVAVFAEFFSPYDPTRYDGNYGSAPPTRIHFVDKNGYFHLRPFVYGITFSRDEMTRDRIYTENIAEKCPILFFVRGDPYKLLGLLEMNIHLWGTERGRLFLLGTDRMGRDMLSRVIYGSRISLTIGLMGIAISFILGIILGGVSGYFGGTIDIVVQRVIEFIRSIPTLPLWMALSVALPPKWSVVKIYFGIVVILSLVSWTGLARVVRGKFLALREEDFVAAARIHGANELRIIFKHLLPSFYSHIIASLTLAVPGMILGETTLSFIGVGLKPPAISWGVLLKQSQSINVLATAPWLLIPGIFVIVAILAFNFVGDGLRDAADPYVNI